MTLRVILLTILFTGAFGACREGDIPPTTTCTYVPPESFAAHPKAQRLQTLLSKYIKKGLPGITLLIRDHHGEWAGSAGMADIGRNVPMSPCMVLKVASITKLFVGVLTHMLVEEGRFRLDDKVDPYLPEEVLKKVKNVRGATIRQLMNHTTGIYDVITDDRFYLAVLNNPDKHWTAEELIKFVYGQKPYFDQGTSCYYSNTNTLLLSMVIEKATNRPHDQLLREKILNPLGLSSTYYYSHEVLPPHTAQGYYDLFNNGTLANVTNYNTGSGNGYGGMFSNVFDLAKFVEVLFKEKQLLKPASLAAMTDFIAEVDPDKNPNDLFLGAGAMKRYFNQLLTSSNYAYGHTGRDLGYSGNVFYFPNQETTYVLLVNYGTNGKSSLRQVYYDFQDELTNEIVKE